MFVVKCKSEVKGILGCLFLAKGGHFNSHEVENAYELSLPSLKVTLSNIKSSPCPPLHRC